MPTSALRAQLQAALDDMLEFLEPDEEGFELDSEAGYTADDVAECGRVAEAFFVAVDGHRGAAPDVLLAAAQSVVEQLNALNDRCHSSLIETDQREQLVPIILNALAAAGLPDRGDVTGAWRRW